MQPLMDERTAFEKFMDRVMPFFIVVIFLAVVSVISGLGAMFWREAFR